jgi:hypothetical protein
MYLGLDNCLPSRVYFVLTMISIVFSSLLDFELSYVIYNIISLLLWTWLLQFLCNIGLETISWIIVIVPIVIIFIIGMAIITSV